MDNDGNYVPLPICGTTSGSYSTSKDWRKSDLNQLGLGINMYLKILKYYMCVFFLLFLLSLPSIMIYYGGTAFSNHNVPIQKFFATPTLGNLGSSQTISASEATVPPTRNLASFIELGCDQKEQVMSDIMHFGMAYKN